MKEIQRAAAAIKAADAILIGAGAGMGVDSGLPDFRGDEGFWRAYPPFRGRSFSEMASPRWFRDDAALAWGFYGHRLNLYRATVPHDGFQILRELCADKSHFIYTSNVDGQFQKAGFDSKRIVECHGSIHHLQCSDAACCRQNPNIWPAAEIQIEVDETTFRAREPLPHCPICDASPRPNILMFGDATWLHERSFEQEERFEQWKNNLRGKVVIIEFGAGTAIPSVRYQSETMLSQHDTVLVRINPREADGPEGTISLAVGAREALQQIQSYRKTA